MLYKHEDGPDAYLGKTDFLYLLNFDSNTLKFCPKLTIEHIKVKGSNRQRVRLATQLLSESVAKAFSHNFGSLYQPKADVISIIDRWFDGMNSRKKYDLRMHVVV